jgi:uncharacterized protein YjbI with pentapeptide repeats
MIRRAFVACLLLLTPTFLRAAEDYSGKSISNADLSMKNLEGANFEDAVCRSTKFSKAVLIGVNFQNADLTGADFSYADVTEADFRNAKLTSASFYRADASKANFEGCDFTGLIFTGVKFREANLRNMKGIANVVELDFYKADLRGADLTALADTTKQCNFRKAMYDKTTRWPQGFDVAAAGAVLVESEPAPAPPAAAGKELAKEFAKLDRNEDGRLSGSEMDGLEKLDTDKNGRITFEEFAAGKK